MHTRDNVEALLVLQPIAVDTGSADTDGRLVIANGMLVAVLVRLADDALAEDEDQHERVGGWFLEFGLGRLRGLRPAPFDTLEDATRWLRRQMRP